MARSADSVALRTIETSIPARGAFRKTGRNRYAPAS
jgi:hypothetical protein